MKKLIVAFSLVAVAMQQAFAVSVYEPFANATASGGSSYTIGSLLCSGFSGATLIEATNATGGVWGCVSNEAGANVTGLPVIASGNLSYTGFSASPGNSLSFPSAVGNMGRMSFPFAAVNSGQCYYSFLLQITDVSKLTTSATSNVFAGFADTVGAQKAAVNRAESYLVAKASGAGYVLGIGKSKPATANQIYDTTVHNVGEVVLVVAAYDYTAAGHPASLWIDPPTNAFGAPTPPTPTLTITNGSDLNPPGIQSFLLGCFTVVPPACVVDELRVGLTWSVVTGAPDVQLPPSGVVTNAGTTATFSVFGTGNGPLSYQWTDSAGNLSDGGKISGSSTATLSIAEVNETNDDNYSVVISNTYGSVTSSVANLSVNDPYIDIPPQPQQVAPNTTATFSVVAGGVPPLIYAWYSNSTPLLNGGSVSGATNATLIIANVTADDDAQYSVYVTDSQGTVQSSAAQLLVGDPSITSSPSSVTTNYGSSATFTVSAEGTSTLTYQWSSTAAGALSDGDRISGSSTSALTISGVSYTDAVGYYVTVGDNGGQAISSTAMLTVIEPIITNQPVSTTNVQGTTAMFSVGAIGAPTLNYVWSKNGAQYTGDYANISGSQTATLTVSSVTAADAASYSVIVSDASGMSVGSANAVLTVLTPPAITAQPLPLTLTPGNTAAFAVGTTGTTPMTFQWYSNTTGLPSATNFAYVLTNVQAGMSGSFSVIASNAYGAATSAVVPLSVVPSIQLASTNLVVVRVGNGAETPDFTGNSVFLDQYDTNGTYLDTVSIPNSGPSALIEMGPIENGTTITGTALSQSGDGYSLVLAGYNTPQPYSGPLFASSAAVVPRGVALINANASYTLAVADSNAYNATYVRGATSDGTNNFWGAGGAGGTYYFGLSAPATTIQAESAFVNLRSVSIFNGNLYTVSGSSSGLGILEWDGLPTNAVTPVDLFTPTGNATDIAIDPTGTILYLGDPLGVMRYDFDGTSWNYQYTLTGDPSLYLTVDFSGAVPVIYTTTTELTFNHLVSIVDNGVGSPAVVLATAGLNESLRGVRFGPAPASAQAPPTLYFTNSAATITLSWSGCTTFSPRQTWPGLIQIFRLRPVPTPTPSIPGARCFSVWGSSLRPMPPLARRIGILAAVAILTFRAGAAPMDRAIPKTLPSHPGNIFLAGEPVVVAEPPGEVATWRLLDYDGKLLANGRFTNGQVELGPLPVGWYKVVRGIGHWTNKVTLGVLEPLRAPTPVDSPIGIDVAMAWMFPDARMAQVINLCQLAGMNRVRDRMLWQEIELRRGRFAAHTRYDDSLRDQTAAGLQVLQVNHVSAAWANSNTMRFPTDLRDVHDAYRELARRWRGQIEAFEPWNEADIKEFGGHTGCEMATLQKAAWLGLKAGNPQLTVCENVFAIHRVATLNDFQDNAAWPYFDTFNLHHYDPFQEYPRLFGLFRAAAAGRPMWVTECNVIVQWKDEKTKEPSEADLRVQSERVPMIYSTDIYQGARAVFYFMLPDYVEYRRQYGVLHGDLSPRPAFLAVASAGRLLAGARPLGRVNSTNQELQGYLFRAEPDGRKSDVLVIWSEHDTTFSLPKPPAACFDHLGRSRTVAGSVLKIGRAPQYFELAEGDRPALIPPPKPAKVLAGKPGSVVLQALLPPGEIDVNQSACRVPHGREMIVPICVYNFGDKTARGKLKVKAPANWTAQLSREVEVEPGGREELSLRLGHPSVIGTNNCVRVIGRFGSEGGAPVLSFRLTASGVTW